MLVRTVYFLLPAVLIVAGSIFAVKVTANMMSQSLREENRKLRAAIEDLRRDEPVKMQNLRREVEAYDTLVDKLLALIARRRNTLDIGPIEDAITNLIEAERPDRSIY